jgi:hypothetical protein
MALVSGKQRRRAAKEGMHVTGQSNSLDVTAVIAEFLEKRELLAEFLMISR